LGLKFIQNFRVEAERRLSRILEKSSSLVENPHQKQTFRFFGEILRGGAERRPLFLRLCARFVREQDEVRFPCDFLRNSVFFSAPTVRICFAQKRIFANLKVMLY